MGRIEDHCADRGITLPDALPTGGVYEAVLIDRDIAHQSGILGVDVENMKLAYPGRLGDDLTLEAGRASARQACLQGLGTLRSFLGTLDRVEQVVKVTGFVRATPDFPDLPGVMDGASELLVEVFGDAGRSARSSVGVAALPFGASVEVEMSVRLRAEQ